MTYYRIVKTQMVDGDQYAMDGAMYMGRLVPVEPDTIRWCLNHRKETWAGRTTCVGMGAADLCNVVDALLIVGEETP